MAGLLDMLQNVGGSSVGVQGLLEAQKAGELPAPSPTPQQPAQGQPDALLTPPPPPSPVDVVYSHLGLVEGNGSNITGDVPTKKLGVTAAAEKAIKGSDKMKPEEVAHAYLEKLNGKFTNMIPRYSVAPPELQTAILDAGYNLGEGVGRYPGLNAAMKAEDWPGAGLQLLDTANAKGKSLRGIAKRRAMMYNNIPGVPNPITTVRQKKDGTLQYIGADGSTVFSYTAKKGRHPDSPVGSLSVY